MTVPTLQDVKTQLKQWEEAGYADKMVAPDGPLEHLFAFCYRQSVTTPTTIQQRINEIESRLSK